MDRTLVRMTPEELESIAPVRANGTLEIDTAALSRVLSRALGLLGLRVAIAYADYFEQRDGVPEPSTRTLSGIWWRSNGDDTSLVGGFITDGLAMTITTEGEGPSPVVESLPIVERAMRAIRSQYEGSTETEIGLIQVPLSSGFKSARVIVTRDHRIRRPEDALLDNEPSEFAAGRLAVVLVQTIGNNKALVLKHGL